VKKDEEFNMLLFRKTLNMTATGRSSARKYYRDQYQKTGVIPKGLYHREGRKASGRKQAHSNVLEEKFVAMVKKSACANINDLEFTTQKLRTIENFKRRLEQEFGEVKPHTLYRLSKKHHLEYYLNKPDDAEPDQKCTTFEAFEVFDLIFMDLSFGHHPQNLSLAHKQYGLLGPCIFHD